MLHKLTLVVLVIFCAFLGASTQDTDNIVPNPGFEQFSAAPLGWFYTGDDFTRTVRYWESATAASPDAYGPRGFIPSEWKEQGFGKTKPYQGKAMVGITCFGCEGGKPHCREYIEIQLKEPLVVGQKYHVEFWANHLPKSLLIQDIGVAFSKERIKTGLDERLDLTSNIEVNGVIKSEDGKWQQIIGTFVAATESNYMIVGNFKNDEQTTYSSSEHAESLTFGYYYLDAFDVHKVPPILDVPKQPNDLSNRELKKGETVVLENIYFDHDKDQFLPRSFLELDMLVGIMRGKPNLRIMIQGHTDNVGTHDYNMKLSLDRAEAVANYLAENGIAAARCSFRGFGSTQPVASNDTEEGRQQNRRVEFVVLSH